MSKVVLSIGAKSGRNPTFADPPRSVPCLAQDLPNARPPAVLMQSSERAARDDRQSTTDLLVQLRHGNPEAMDQLLPLVYAELRLMASSAQGRATRSHARHDRS